jgi:hypothetical protein
MLKLRWAKAERVGFDPPRRNNKTLHLNYKNPTMLKLRWAKAEKVGFDPPRRNNKTLHLNYKNPTMLKLRWAKAERVGFEPTVQYDPYDDLANRSFRPLRHLSFIFLFRGVVFNYDSATRSFRPRSAEPLRNIAFFERATKID